MTRALLFAIALTWYSSMVLIAVWHIVGTPPPYAITAALGTLAYHALREIRNWLE